jgi:glycosyltransferase involved in cell wall biosynthesis
VSGLRIAIVAQAHTSVAEPFAGGLEAHTHALASRLVERGHDVTVHAAASAGSQPFRLRAMRPVRVDDSEARADMCESPAAARAEALAHIHTMTSLTAGDYDLVHLNTTHFMPFACASTLRVPVTATLHCPPYERLAAVLRDQRNVSVATVSHSNARAWRRHAAVDAVLTNGIDLERWRPGAGGDGAVWVGRIVPEKAPDLAIAAARRAGVKLRLVGPVHDRRYFANHIEPHLDDDITHVGHVPSTELARLVGRADVAVVTPAWDEPFGLVVAEALACGTPVAAIGRGAVRELIVDDVGVVVDGEDPRSLAGAILAASRLDRGACREHAEVHFDQASMVDRYEAWFLGAAASSSGRRTPDRVDHRSRCAPSG